MYCGQQLGQWEAVGRVFGGLFSGKKKKKVSKIINESTYGSLPPPYDGPVPDISGSYSIPPQEGPYGGQITQDGPYFTADYRKNITGGTVTPSQGVFTGSDTLAITSTNGTVSGRLSGSTITWSNGVHFNLGQPPGAPVSAGEAPGEDLQIFSVPSEQVGFMQPRPSGGRPIFRREQGMSLGGPDLTPWLIGGGIFLAGVLLLRKK